MNFDFLFFSDYCEYKGQRYTHGETWEDGCDYNCVCEDASTGSWRCVEKWVILLLFINICREEFIYQVGRVSDFASICLLFSLQLENIIDQCLILCPLKVNDAANYSIFYVIFVDNK